MGSCKNTQPRIIIPIGIEQLQPSSSSLQNVEWLAIITVFLLQDLHHIEYLPSTKLREWCAQNTKRLDFVELLPISFFDLVDKCLTVNPRQRISAEDALRHEFFAPCYEELKKHKQLRHGVEPASKCSRLAHRPYLTNQGLS